MSYHKRLIFLWVLFIGPLSALIVETSHFRDILSHVTPGTLILMDIDDTLLIPKQTLGGECWFDYRWKKYQSEGLSSSEALQKTLAEWEAIRHLTKMELVEPGTAEVIQELQRDGCSVMALTVQELSLHTRTRLHLQEQEINLSHSGPFSQDVYTNVAGHGVLYRHGILHTSGRNKGLSFFQICDQTGYVPQKVVLIDDKLSHLKAVESYAEARGIEFIGLRYGYNDARKAAFDQKIADIQWEHSRFGRILSDEEAASINIE